MSSRRVFLQHTAAAGAALAAGAGRTHACGQSAAVRLPTYREYLYRSAVPRRAIEEFLRGPGWARFDSEVGYVLSNSLQADGVDSSGTLSTIQANGARRAFLYADRKPRISTYGNSFTQGHQVSDGETWQEYLAAHLGEPIGNFGMGGHGVYQAYRRMIREERTPCAAEYIIFYIWGDDAIRSLFRARWASNYPAYRWLLERNPQFFHNNFWSNVEMDLATGGLAEKGQLLTTPESLYRMSQPDFMLAHLEDDLAVQLEVFRAGLTRDLNRKKISRLAEHLDFAFDWNRETASGVLPGRTRWERTMTRIQAHAGELLDRYALRGTRFILDKVRAFAHENDKKLLVLLFDPYRAMVELRERGTRWDQEIVDHLQREKVEFFDMNEVHLEDYQKYKLSWDDYLKQHFIGHYSPAGNHFFAFAIKDKIVQWLNPKPLPYQNPDQQSVSFRGYLKGYE